ncbi:MAG: PH domain-containing protein [Oscillospiraceae bacterium]|nr:PH domain-containing protein [Oscillospiraceae bacterium]
MVYRNRIEPKYIIPILLPLFFSWVLCFYRTGITLTNITIVLVITFLFYSPLFILILCSITKLEESGIYIKFFGVFSYFVPYESIIEISVTEKGFSYLSLSNKKIKIVWTESNKQKILLVSPQQFSMYYDQVKSKSINAVE